MVLHFKFLQMRKDKVISNYVEWTDFELSTLAGRVVVAMNDEATQEHFPTPDPDLETLENLASDFIAKHEVASQRGSALQISQKNESRLALLAGLRKLAHYVNGVADGRTSLLLSTGLVLASAAKPLTTPRIPERIRLRDSLLKGQMRLDFLAVKEAWEYEINVGESSLGDPAVQWTHTFATTSSRGNILTDLSLGVIYHVRVRARNGRGIGDWSEPISLMAR